MSIQGQERVIRCALQSLGRALGAATGLVGPLVVGLWAAGLVAVGCPAVARADEVTGTWTGNIHGDLHYFWERSTRVVIPEGGVQLESPDGIRLGADYLVDAITSASIGFGVDSDDLFTEIRHEPQLSVGKLFQVDGAKIDVTAVARYSTENDYESFSAGATGSVSFNEDNTVIRANLIGLHDEIRANNDGNFRESIDGWTVSAAIEQVLGPTSLIVGGYQLGLMRGFMGNAYRQVLRDGAPVGESPPRFRARHTLYARFAQYIPPLGGAVHVMARGYLDSWQMWALNPEVRFYKEFGDYLMVRLRYRFYRQRRPWFFRDVYPQGWDDPVTADPKLSSFRSHMLGIRFDVDTPFLGGTFLDFARDSTLYLSINHNIVEGHRYGSAVIGSAGGILRF